MNEVDVDEDLDEEEATGNPPSFEVRKNRMH